MTTNGPDGTRMGKAQSSMYIALVGGAAGHHWCVIAALLVIAPTDWRDCQHLLALRDMWWRRAGHELSLDMGLMGICAVNQ